MRTATIAPAKPANGWSYRPWLIGFYMLVLCCAGLLIGADAQARVDGVDPVVKLHLPVHLEGRQTVRLNRLVDEYYDIDLESYVLREVVLETDGANNRRNAFASLQVGRYRTGRVGLNDNLTSLEAPVVHSSQWRLQLGSGARAHGILLVLSERSYSDYRTHPHHGASLGLGWFQGDRDYYFFDRYARPGFLNRYPRDYFRGTWNGDYRLRFRNNISRSQWLREQRRAERRQRRALQRERQRNHERDDHRGRPADRERDAVPRQWRGNERQAHQRQHRPDRVQQQRITTPRARRDAPRADRRARSNREQRTRSASPPRADRSPRAQIRTQTRSRAERPRSVRPQQRQRRSNSGAVRQSQSKRVRM